MARRQRSRWLWRSLAALLLIALVAAAAGWWHLRHWTPPVAEYPLQGALVGESDGRLDFRSLGAVGAQFVYLEASAGDEARDPSFARNYAHAKRIGIPVGAVHTFDPCIPAEQQAANFVTVVPRDGDLLPPAIALDRTAEDCDSVASEAGVESELMTFLNQIESHAGKPAILKVSERFEDHYHLANRLERSLWLEGDRVEPDYAGRPFALWTANGRLMSAASEKPLHWVVAQP